MKLKQPGVGHGVLAGGVTKGFEDLAAGRTLGDVGRGAGAERVPEPHADVGVREVTAQAVSEDVKRGAAGGVR